MFRNSINTTPLTTDIADTVFTNINADRHYQSDVSFLATLRALLAPRMKTDDKLTLRFSSTNYNKHDLESTEAGAALDAITHDMHLGSDGYFTIHYFRSDADSNAKSMEIVRENFLGKYAGYERLEKMTAFFSKSFGVLCFLNKKKKTVAIFVDAMDNRRLHYLQLGILPALPWYFDPAKGVTDLEMRLIHSLNERTSENYMACLDEIAAQYDFRSAAIKSMLNGYEMQFRRREMDAIRNNIRNLDAEIDRMNDAIAANLRRRNDSCIKLLGLETKDAQSGEDSEIMDYFLCNRKMHLESTYETEMTFTVADYLAYFDKDVVERVLGNTRSYIYHTRSGDLSTVQMKKLIRAVFIDETLRIRVCAAYKFDIQGNVRALDGHVFPNNLTNSHIPNPHINRFRCMGNYQHTINRLLKDGDYIGALEQCSASNKSLNFTDSTVMEYFVKQLYRNEYCCVELPDGKVVKPKEAIKWLEEQEVAKREQEKKREGQEEPAHE